MTTTCKTMSIDLLRERATRLGLHGLLARWDEVALQPWVAQLCDWEEDERHKRSLERRIAAAHIGRFKSFSDFDWKWPKNIDREQIEDLFASFSWVDEGFNVIFIGPNAVGKTMFAQNLTYQAVLRGYSSRFVSASEMLNDLASRDTAAALQRSLRTYAKPKLLVVDELGYLSYNTRHADLLFEVINRRHSRSFSTVVTTNKGFSEWQEVFPNATCVVTLVDRLIHKAEIVEIAGDSYRKKEAEERTEQRARERAVRRRKKIA